MLRELRVRAGGVIYTAVVLVERKRAPDRISSGSASVRVRDRVAQLEEENGAPVSRFAKFAMAAAFSLIALVGLGVILFYTALLGTLILGK